MIHAIFFNQTSEEIQNGIFDNPDHAIQVCNKHPEAEYFVICQGCPKCQPYIKNMKRLSIISKIAIASGVILLGLAVLTFIAG